MTRRVAVLVAVAAISVSCGGGKKKAAAPAPPVITTTTAAKLGPAAPLLGTPGAPKARPALIVKIDNAPKGRPQAGINAADVVVEEMVEGGVTRLFCIFQSADADPLGPVRSARSTDVLLVGSLNRPLFAYAGANAAFQRLVSSAPIVDVGIDHASADYRREPGRPIPYNLFSTTAALFRHAPAGAGPPAPMFPYGPSSGGAPVGGVHVEYRGRIVTAVDWRWDAASKEWKRTENGTPHVDTAGQQVSVPNVVVAFTPYVDTPFVDQSGARVPEAQVVGDGAAWVLTDGKLVEGRWHRGGTGEVTRYTDASGQPIRLTPGQTWVELAPPGSAAKA